jgi:hypothetical protein
MPTLPPSPRPRQKGVPVRDPQEMVHEIVCAILTNGNYAPLTDEQVVSKARNVLAWILKE